MKIAYLVPRFYPFKGGAEENCYQLASRMSAAGHKVTVITTDFSPDNRPLLHYELINGIKVIRLHRWNKQLNLGFYPSLWPTLMKLDADVLHVENGPGYVWQEFCLFWKHMFNRKLKIIVTPHGPFLASKNNVGIKAKIASLGRKIMPLYFKIVWPFIFTKVIAVTPTQHIWLTKDYGIKPAKITVITNGIPGRMLISHKQITPDQKIVITFTGRFEKYKGVQDILSAISKVLELQPKLKPHLEFIGMGRPGAYYQTLLQMIKDLGLQDNAQLLDSPDNDTRDRVLSEMSQVHVLPGEWEGTGIVLLEAMAKGNAIITTSTNDGAEMLIDEGKNGFIYNFGDTNTLVKDLLLLINNFALRQEMININLAKIKQFTWEEIFPHYQELVKSLV